MSVLTIDIVDDLSNPPDISGVWKRVSREMYERNPGDGATKGIVKLDPPDPSALGGGIVMKISQEKGSRTYLFSPRSGACNP